jgi:hypothetical protein
MAGDRPICRRTADRLEAYDIVRFPGFEDTETVLRVHELDDGARMVRTTGNMHWCAPDLLIEVVAVSVPGIGFVAPREIA